MIAIRLKILAAVAAATLLATSLSAFAGPKPAILFCINPQSGARFSVTIDFARRTADGFPAAIDKERISWSDTLKGGAYDFDRHSGALTVRFASSTGGYFLHDRCRLEE